MFDSYSIERFAVVISRVCKKCTNSRHLRNYRTNLYSYQINVVSSSHGAQIEDESFLSKTIYLTTYKTHLTSKLRGTKLIAINFTKKKK
jgi:hypothetical protein